MSRADELRARYAAELAVLDLEDELVAAKDAGDLEAIRDVKDRLRSARQSFRESRAGDGTASPATIETSATVTDLGG
jgi:hypothetical protein